MDEFTEDINNRGSERKEEATSIFLNQRWQEASLEVIEVNSKAYWDMRFRNDWNSCDGSAQSRFFAKLAAENMPKWLWRMIQRENLILVDWGYAEGDGTALLASCYDLKQVVGVDFSTSAIEIATKRYPNIHFIVEDWLTSYSENNDIYDVIFSSNTLEHFYNPFEVLNKIGARASKAIALALPYREFNRTSEHFFSFSPNNIPASLSNGFRLVWSRVVDCNNIDKTYWLGEQIFLVYADSSWLDGLSLKLFDFCISFKSRDQNATLLAERVVIRDKQIDDLNQTIAERDQAVKQLSTDLHAIYSSRSWRAILFVQAIKQQLLPRGSRRESIAKRVYGFIRNIYRAINKLKYYLYKSLHIIKRYGVVEFCKRLFVQLASFNKIYQTKKLLAKHEEEHAKILDTVLNKNINNPIVVFPVFIDWNIPLFQRPQHIAVNLAKEGMLCFFCTQNFKYDNINGFINVNDGCYITNRFDLVSNIKTKKIIHICSTDLKPIDEFINTSLSNGDIILYEYIDEIHEDIGGKIPQYVLDRHLRILKDERCIVVATADSLYKEVLKYRSKNCALITNGVEYDHFSKKYNKNDIPEEIINVLNKNKPVIGYFGALAKWFDYELIEKLARERANYEILLIGWNYDNTLNKYNLSQFQNITIIGPIDYKRLPRYAHWFNVSIIPFRINEITESTSPIKLFEYMALGHPIVTTNLSECRKYRSALIGKDHDHFIEQIDKALKLASNDKYIKILNDEALANTWNVKARAIAELIRNNIDFDFKFNKQFTATSHSLAYIQNLIIDSYRQDGLKNTYYETTYSKEEYAYWSPVISWITEIPSVSSIIDIGAAYGTLLIFSALNKNSQNLHAIDSIGYMSKTLIRNFNIVFHSIDFEREIFNHKVKFDLIIFTEVIEHLNYHPDSTLQKIKKLMHKESYLILTTPDATDWGRLKKYYSSLHEIPHFRGQVSKWIDDHIWQYTKNELEIVFLKNGFQVEKFSYAPGVSGRKHLCFMLKIGTELN